MDKDASSNIYLTGAIFVTGQGFNYITTKFNSSLAVVWSSTYNANNLDDYAKAVKVDASGNVYVTGYTTGSNGRDFTTIKYNSSGTQQWVKTYNNSIVNGDDEAADLVIDSNNDIYITGSVTDNLNGLDFYTTKYDPSGNVVWEIQSDGMHTNDKATNMALDSLNNVIVTGQTEISPGNYVYGTVKYIQKDVITPTDFNGELPSNNFMYYANKGQLIGTNDTLIPDIKFYTHNTYPLFFIKNNSSSFVFARIDTIAATNDTLHRIDLTYDKSRSASKAYPLEQQREGYLNYYLAHTDSNGVTGVFGNKRLITPDIYPNIDLMYSSNQNGIKYYYIIKPGGNPTDIEMTFTGATSFSLNGTSNELSINSSIGSLIFDRPTAYQLTTSNATVAVTGWTPDWQTNGASNKYKFNTGSYTSSLTLVIQVDQGNSTSSIAAIDNLVWSTYYGNNGGRESGQSIKNDNLGNIFVGGFSNNPSFPVTTGSSYVPNDIGNGILIKFNANRQKLWSTYFGGSTDEQITSIAPDNSNSFVYACGYSWSSDFPKINKVGATISPIFQGYSDAFIAGFRSSNGAVIWSNLIGTSGDERAYSICMDASGNKYVVGYTASGLTLVNTASYYTQNTYGGGASDGFIAKFNSSDQLSWLTYYGGNSEDYPKSVITDVSGNIIVWGQTGSTTFNTFDPDPLSTTKVYNTTNAGQTDFFLLKFNSSGSRIWATLYGGASDDWAADGDGLVTVGNDIYCFGTTFSSNLPIKQFGSTPTFSLNGDQDCYIVCFTPNFEAKWATYYGGSNTDWAGAITKDNNNNIFITGSTNSSDFNIVNQTGFYNGTFYGSPGNGPIDGDLFINAFANDSFAPIWSTFVGGSRSESGFGISIFNNKLFITGETLSSSFNSLTPYPVADPGNNAYQFSPPNTIATGNGDIIISEFDINGMSIQVSINENEMTQSDVSIYPNPFTNKINIIGVNEKSTIEIFDAVGKVVFSSTIKNEENSLNLSITVSGIYILRITNNNNGEYKSFKIVKY